MTEATRKYEYNYGEGKRWLSTGSLLSCLQMIPMGNAECTVKDLLQSPNFQVRVEIRYKDIVELVCASHLVVACDRPAHHISGKGQQLKDF